MIEIDNWLSKQKGFGVWSGITLKQRLMYAGILAQRDYINNPLWENFYNHMEEVYHIEPRFEFSKCSWEYGWNAKFKKGSKSLCTIYPRENYFTAMVVIGKKEKEHFEEMLPSLCIEIQKIYAETKEGNGQRWLMIDLEDEDETYFDVLKILAIRAA